MELHFYPGQKLLVVKEVVKETVNGVEKEKEVVKGRFEAWGGPSSPGTDPRMQEIPTTAGTYVIHSVHPYTTSSWQMSGIKWGTRLKDRPDLNPSDVWYELPSGLWGSVKKDFGIKRKDIMNRYHALYGSKAVPERWVFNDFGPAAVRYFKDTNNNLKLDKDKGERLSGEMIHTTPKNEAQFATGEEVRLGPSHGCVHIRPQDRDTLLRMNAFKPGTLFIVHGYGE